MPFTIAYQTGQNTPTADAIVAAIELPDSGQTINISGSVAPLGVNPVAITPNTLTAPVPPGSGTTVFIIQVNKTTGVASIKSQATTAPPADTGNELLSTQTLSTTSTDMAVVPDTTPDTA